MFDGVRFYIFPLGFGQNRKKILENQITKNHGTLSSTPENADYVIVEEDVSGETVQQTLASAIIDDSRVKAVRFSWLTGCIKAKSRISEAEYVILINRKSSETGHSSAPSTSAVNSTELVEKSDATELKSSEAEGNTNNKQKRKIGEKFKRLEPSTVQEDSSDGDESIDVWFGDVPRGEAQANRLTPEKKAKFVCAMDSSLTPPKKDHNRHIIEKLQILADGYKSSNDRWRTLSYEKAIKQLERLDKPVETEAEARGLTGVGARIARKIWEIASTGDLAKAKAFEHNERLQTMKLFTDIWGVGPVIAEQWFAKGFRTLDDVKTKAKLNHQQKIGLQYYDDILDRMPRAEAQEIVDEVSKAAHSLFGEPDGKGGGLICQACGSFRRGRPTCGDVDILLTHPDSGRLAGVLQQLVAHLSEIGFLTDHLVECQTDGHQKKYMGVCRLLTGENRKHRRLDIISVPFNEYPTSLIYFTGSAHFTRSIYALAKRSGMRLNHHGLRGGVMRAHGEKLNEGYPIPTPTEESVFERLGIPFRTPEQRDHL